MRTDPDWDKIDDLNEVVASKCDFSLNTIVTFNKDYQTKNIKISKNSKGIILERQRDYYALAVNGQYIEKIHKDNFN